MPGRFYTRCQTVRLNERGSVFHNVRLVEEDAATLQKPADEYGVSAERIRQIEAKALKAMRSEIAA